MNKLLCISLCILFTGCMNSGKKEIKEEEGPFSPLLKQKIQEFIQYADSVRSGYKDDEMFYALNAKSVDDTNILVLRTEYYYNPDLYQIGGYTFLDSNLVVFENAAGPIYLEHFKSFNIKFFTPVALIDSTKLIKFQDSIPGYMDGRKGVGEYEPLMRKYRLIGRDSLVLIFSGPN